MNRNSKLAHKQVARRDFMRMVGVGAVSAAATACVAPVAQPKAAPAAGDAKAPAVISGKPFAGQKVAVTVNTGGEKGPISGPLYEHRAEWEDMTGAKLEIVEIPFENHYTKFVTDAQTGAGQYDISMAGAWWLGDFIAGDFIIPYDQYYGDKRFPAWTWESVLPALQGLYSWGGKKYMVPNDGDGQVFYYRRDAFTKPENKGKFMEKYKYELPAPPTTMQQMRDCAEFFNNWDWNGDGQPDSGISMHLKVGGQGMFHFMTLSAPYLISPDSKLYWFDPESMEPLITSDGHKAALDALIELVGFGPKASLGWSLGEAWDYFLKGKAAMAFSWGDLGALAQEKDKSKVQGLTASAPMPGTNEHYNIAKKAQVKTDKPNKVGNTTGGSWSGVISKASKAPDAAFHLLSYHASQPLSSVYAMRGWDGVDPGRTFHFAAPIGDAKVDDYVSKGGWDKADIADYLAAYADSFSNPVQFPYLRIPGTFEYWVALDKELSEAVTGSKTAAAALADAAKTFNDITDRLGRDKQKELYKSSLGL